MAKKRPTYSIDTTTSPKLSTAADLIESVKNPKLDK